MGADDRLVAVGAGLGVRSALRSTPAAASAEGPQQQQPWASARAEPGKALMPVAYSLP